MTLLSMISIGITTKYNKFPWNVQIYPPYSSIRKI